MDEIVKENNIDTDTRSMCSLSSNTPRGYVDNFKHNEFPFHEKSKNK